VIASTVAHATIAELLEAVFTVRSVPRPCSLEEVSCVTDDCCELVVGTVLRGQFVRSARELTAEGSTR
jgi:hypothetical protein